MVPSLTPSLFFFIYNFADKKVLSSVSLQPVLGKEVRLSPVALMELFAMGSLSQTIVPLNPPHIPGSIFSPGLTPPIVLFPDQEHRQLSYYKTATTHSTETSSLNLHASICAERSREDLEAAGYEIPALTANASFGDMRNAHYLIPDLPPPQKN
ncbi:hypothetical protein PHLCEN_2v11702 [Hermanssonia centrifuga]|uniref:Uncharacterized protein n=1 Tax=Hermanssonia centrifuga TaxID=98765 RepID=A0A2R6NJD8_9APHY|nr:hypothetical protein PHLCEN_2v11702 [Hermanssonia centrifuga]